MGELHSLVSGFLKVGSYAFWLVVHRVGRNTLRCYGEVPLAAETLSEMQWFSCETRSICKSLPLTGNGIFYKESSFCRGCSPSVCGCFLCAYPVCMNPSYSQLTTRMPIPSSTIWENSKRHATVSRNAT